MLPKLIQFVSANMDHSDQYLLSFTETWEYVFFSGWKLYECTLTPVQSIAWIEIFDIKEPWDNRDSGTH